MLKDIDSKCSLKVCLIRYDIIYEYSLLKAKESRDQHKKIH